MNYRILLGIAIVFLTILACNSSKQDEYLAEIPVIDLTVKSQYIDTSVILRDAEIIPLNSQDPAALFQFGSKLMVSDSYYTLVDEFQQKIIQFDHQGQFIRTVGRQGKGPGEYVQVDDVFWDDIHFSVLDGGSGKIHLFDVEGKWETSKSFTLNLVGSSFAKLGDIYLFYHEYKTTYPKGIHYNLISGTLDDPQVLDSAALIDERLANSILQNHLMGLFSVSQQNAYALLPYDSLMYHMDASGKIAPAYHLRIPVEAQLKQQDFYSNKQIEGPNLFPHIDHSNQMIQGFKHLDVGPEKISFQYKDKGYEMWCLFDQKSHKTNVFHLYYLNQLGLGTFKLMAYKNGFAYFLLENPKIESINQRFQLDLKLNDDPFLIKWKVPAQ
jgi:hypothetical protein